MKQGMYPLAASKPSGITALLSGVHHGQRKIYFQAVQTQYPDDDACLRAIFARKFGETKHCPSCGVESKLVKIEGRRAFACQEGCHIYPCAGTVFEKSRTKLTLWFHAMYLMTATRNGVSAKELQRQLGVTYKCAHRMGHQIRELMAAWDFGNTSRMAFAAGTFPCRQNI